MKKLWRRAAGKMKDVNTIWMASLIRKSRHRHPALEAAMIKATSHDDSLVDHKNAQRVFACVQTSSFHVVAFLSALTRRVERTRSWVVALKSLIVLHGVLCTKAPGTRKIGRLPFDLCFEDGYTREKPRRKACYEFVQAYFAFLDLKSVMLLAELKDEMIAPTVEENRDGLKILLVRVQRWQDLLDAVIEVRPNGGVIADELMVLKAMDCLIIEAFELYSKIWDGIGNAQKKIYEDKVGKAEASMALNVLQNASRQGKDLSDYVQFCRKIGLLHARECPKIEQITKEEFSELTRIINGGNEIHEDKIIKENNSRGAMVLVVEKRYDDHQEGSKPWLKTVITDKWEVFDEDISEADNVGDVTDPFAVSLYLPPGMHYNPFID